MTDRKHTAEDVIKKKLETGEIISQSVNDISVTKWKDKKDVSIITNTSNVGHIYNYSMFVIDPSDQMFSYHSA